MITEQELIPAEVESGLCTAECGAVLTFLGVVRNNHASKRVRGVTYEAFVPLAEEVFAQMIEECRSKFSCQVRARIAHRTGYLRVGEVSTVIAVAAPHRDECYAASRYIIENLKVRVPIWKEEHYEDGESEWLDGAEISSGSVGGGTVLSNGEG